jgi:hypothetical protein
VATRSPVLGYNHNVKYKGRIYHVQTEDSGPTNPHLFTHLYYEGTILATKRHEYDGAETEEVVRALMQDQHKAILKDLKHEVYDGKLAAFFGRRGEGHDVLAHAEVPLAAAAPPAPMPVIDTMPEPEVELEVAAEVILDPMPDMPTIPVEVPPPMEMAPPAALEIPLPSIEIEMPPPVAADALPPLEVVLDLDALPQATGTTPPPEVAPPPQASTGGPGVYTFRRPAVDKTPSVPPPHIRREHPSQVMPVVVFDPVVERPAAPPPAPPPPAAPRPTTRVPVPPQPAAHARPPSVRPTQSPVSPVVVQRQVVVGTGGNRGAPGGGRPRRPAPSIPYVVKEGSHPTVQAPQPRQQGPRSSGSMPAVGVPPARPMVPPPATSANASRTASQPPRPQPAEISDKSLDEVILAYLAKGEGPE